MNNLSIKEYLKRFASSLNKFNADKLEVIKKEILIRVNISNQFFILVDGYSSDLDCFTNNNEIGLKSTLDFYRSNCSKHT